MKQPRAALNRQEKMISKELREGKLSSRNRLGVLPPLFERLRGDDPLEVPVREILDMDGLEASIIQEISTILNTRSSAKKEDYEEWGVEGTPYMLPEFLGLADFSFFDAASQSDWPQIERYIETVIQAIDPRLRNPKVKVEKFDSFTQRMEISIRGDMVIGKLVRKITFPLMLSSETSARFAA